MLPSSHSAAEAQRRPQTRQPCDFKGNRISVLRRAAAKSSADGLGTMPIFHEQRRLDIPIPPSDGEKAMIKSEAPAAAGKNKKRKRIAGSGTALGDISNYTSASTSIATSSSANGGRVTRSMAARATKTARISGKNSSAKGIVSVFVDPGAAAGVVTAAASSSSSRPLLERDGNARLSDSAKKKKKKRTSVGVLTRAQRRERRLSREHVSASRRWRRGHQVENAPPFPPTHDNMTMPEGHDVQPLPAAIEDIELRHFSEPAYCRHYVKDIYCYMRSLQFRYPLKKSFIDEQGEINETMRAILVDWLVEVADEYKLLPDTLYLCVNYIDRCLDNMPVSKPKLQLLGCACMLLASKYEEIYPPSVDEFVYISDNTYTRDEVLRMETRVLKALNFNLTASTAKNFLRRYQRAAHVRSEEKNLCNYLCELTLQHSKMVHWTPSLTAASALFLSRMMLYGPKSPNFGSPMNPPIWTNNLVHYTGYAVEELYQCARQIRHLQAVAEDNNLQAVYEKYSLTVYEEVALISPYPEGGIPPNTEMTILTGGR